MRLKTLQTIDLRWALRYYSKQAKIRLQLLLSNIRGRTYWPVEVDGIVVKLTWLLPYQHAYAYNEAHHRHEHDLLIRWKKEAEKATVIYDAGSYNGLYGLIAAAANPRAHVVIFEPNPTQAENVRQNIRFNGLTNVTFVPKAVSGSAGMARFRKDVAGSAGKIDGAGEWEVETTTLEAHGAPDLIKLDIVGGEYDALSAASKLLRKKNVHILLELYPENKERLLPWLQSVGYAAEFLRPRADGGVAYYWITKYL